MTGKNHIDSFSRHFRAVYVNQGRWLLPFLACLFIVFTLLFLDSADAIHLAFLDERPQASQALIPADESGTRDAGDEEKEKASDKTGNVLEGKDNTNEENRKRVIRTCLLYLTIGCGIFLVRYLYEGMKQDFFTSIVGLLAAVILSGEILNTVLLYFINNAYPKVLQRVYLACSLLSYGGLVFGIVGFYPMSTRLLLKSMRRKLLYHEWRDSDWVKTGEYYPVDIVPMDIIPQSTERVNGTETKDLYKTVNRFLRGPLFGKRRDRFILMGGFGSGKSTALYQCVQQQLSGSVLHTRNIPVYVKLREWLSDDQNLAEIKDKGRNTLSQQNEYMDQLFRIITADSTGGNESEVMKNVLLKLHESRRLVYVFDGMNEVLQRKGTNAGDNDKQNEQFAKNMAAFLYRFASGNPCIISMCEMPRVITSKSILIGRPDDYAIWAVKGVRLEKKRDMDELNGNPWMKKLISDVALYRLARASLYEQKEQKGMTVFGLLENYVKRQIANELIDKGEQESCYNAVNKAIEESMQGNVSAFLHSPYSGLAVSGERDNELFRHMCNARLFYEEAHENKEEIQVNKEETQENRQKREPEQHRYHPSHIIIFEYFLANYLKGVFFSKNKTEPSEGGNSSESNTEPSMADCFCGDTADKRPDILELPHLKAIFSMLMTEIFFSCTDEDKIKSSENYFSGIINWISDHENSGTNNNILNFLLLLSQINDDLICLKSAKTLDSVSGCFSKKIRSYIEEDKLMELSRRFALIKLLPAKGTTAEGTTAKGTTKEKLLESIRDEALKKSWVQLPLQRQIIQYESYIHRNQR